MKLDASWQLRFWRVPDLPGVELMHGIDITYDYPRHLHEEHSIAIVLQGVETHICGGASHRAIAGDLLLINAETTHASRSEASSYRVIKIQTDVLNAIAEKTIASPFAEPIVRDAALHDALLNLHLLLCERRSRLEHESELIATISLLLTRNRRETLAHERLHVTRVRDYLRAHFAENVSLSELTALTDLNPFHLLRIFRSECGIPPHEYQTQLRVAHARRLIRHGTSFADAALQAGFFDQSHLCRNFKRIVGMTPGQYLSRSKIVQEAAG